MEEYHLVKQFSKPKEGEYVPITFIEFLRKLVGWSPELKRSVYIENEGERQKLKRVREVNVMVAVNHLSGKTSTIELTDEEKAQFEEVYSLFLENGGQLMYTRKKMGTKTVSFFELDVKKKAMEMSGRRLLSESI
ncbi:MAG: hypothetical protein PHU34_06055 [Candidatus Methanoperedens sp.]|nr:hypothetical protein [Candidatus Methanoperedens sp.]